MSDASSRSRGQRFTVDGSDRLEEQLNDWCGGITADVLKAVPADRLVALVLAGVYGRGEGGVLREAEKESAYNDLEFYGWIRARDLRGRREWSEALHEVGERWTEQIGVEVEFKLLVWEQFVRSGPTMFYYDLAMGHRILHGNQRLFEACPQLRDASGIPLSEAARLLLNRCSGLLFSQVHLEGEVKEEEADFVGRNLAKTRLAMGDVVLTVAGQYHWSCRERHERIKQLAAKGEGPGKGRERFLAMKEILSAHEAGVEFKLHPRRAIPDELALRREHAQVSQTAERLWLWLEEQRLGRRFDLIEDYSFGGVDKCPESGWLRNRLVHWKHFGWRAALGARSGRYPREQLLNALPLLLWRKRAVEQEAQVRERVAGELKSGARDWAGLVQDYEKLWRRFN